MRALLKLGRFLSPYRAWALLAPLLMALEVAMDLMQPHLVQQIVDQGVAKSDMGVVIHTGGLMIGCALVGLIGGAGCTYFAVLAGQGFGADLRRTLFAKVQSLSFGNIDHLETGSLITRLTNDVNQALDVVMMVLRILVRVPLMIVGSLVMGYITSPMLSLVFVPLVPLVLGTLAIIISRSYPLFSQVQERLDHLNTVLQENLSGVRVVKAFARSDYEIGRFRNRNEDLRDRNIAAARVGAITMPLMILFVNLGVVAVIWFGGHAVIRGDLSVGKIIAFINYLIQALISLMFVSMLIVQLARAEASAKRIHEVLDSQAEVKDRSQAQSGQTFKGRIEFENVGFGYRKADEDRVLQHISFVAEPGQTVAILGSTGVGKTSLVNLVPRFYDVTHGRVTLDGTDIRDLTQESLRGAVSIALQESILFTGTIRDNIRYGRPEASDEEVEQAAKVAQAHDFIQKLPDGYDTAVGQRGVNLSGGQKQRIAIARALLPKPAVLILDDSTSAVDVRTEALIQQGLQENHRTQTRLIVAQRISTVLNADKILVLEDGKIIASGNHEELLESSPVYQEIYSSQTNNPTVEEPNE